MKVKRRSQIVCAWIIVIMVICGLVQPVHAKMADSEAKQTVKVAYFDIGDYYTKNPDGTVSSYDTEMLKKISTYSNLQFEYVDCGTWANALDMLNRGEVDLVGTMQRTKQREQEYEFCLKGYGYTVGELAGHADKNYVYEDYEQIGDAVIGCTYNYVCMNEMRKVFEEHDISPTIKMYEGQTELEEALASGEIDLIAANSHTLKANLTVVEKFSFAPFYFASRKGNANLTDQIDAAIIKINLEDSTADDTLLKRYFPDMFCAPLTKEELDLIDEGKTYTIYYDTTTKPLAWYDKKSDTMKGALVEACEQITDITGLKIEVRPINEKPQGESDTTIEYTTLFEDTNADLEGKEGVTDALIMESFNLYHRIDHKIDFGNGTYTVAIMKNRNLLKDYIEETYPGCDVVLCDTPAECIDKLEHNDVELAYLDIHVADNVLTETGISDIRQVPQDAAQHGIGMLFEGKDSALLSSIVNKGIQRLDMTQISDSMVQNAFDTHEKTSARTIIRDYGSILLIAAFALFFVLLGMAVVFTYANVMRKQKDKVMKADEDKTEFFSRMSHDMRTPMNGILGMIRLTKDSVNVAEIHENMNKAEAAGEYMLSLINDTLDLQKLESKKLELEYKVVYVREFLENFMPMMRYTAKEKGVALEIKRINWNKDQYVVLDPIRVQQIFSNVISNAIKFTPTGGAVEITVEAIGEEVDVLHRKVIVKDTGVGMSGDFVQNRLFQPYAQENSKMTNQLTGTGLGMAITKNLVELMNGHIEVQSELGEGSAFTVFYDVERASEELIDQFESEKNRSVDDKFANLSGRHILLCEDHPLNAEIAQRLLEKIGCIVEWAKDGSEGVECFQHSEQNHFDLILMDIRMPVMDGLEATRKIRALKRADAKCIPIVAMTANAYKSDIQNCLDAGMNGHLAKPVEPQQLYQAIAQQVESGEMDGI